MARSIRMEFPGAYYHVMGAPMPRSICHNMHTDPISPIRPHFSNMPTPFLPGAVVSTFKSLHVKNPTHDSWSNTWSTVGGAVARLGTDSYNVSDIATYCNDGWARATHVAMGHVAPEQRWVHLFINGIYWGPYQITERVDDDFMDSHFGGGDYTVMKQGPEALEGNISEWNDMVAQCQAVAAAVVAAQTAGLAAANALAAYNADPTPANDAARQAADDALATANTNLADAYALVTAAVDLPNYIDYVIVNSFMANQDWCGNNWRAAKAGGGSWKFFIWDAEWTFRPGEQRSGIANPPIGTSDPYAYFGCGQQMVIANSLKGYQPFRNLFSDRIKRIFFVDANIATSGALAIVNDVNKGVERFETEMAKFVPVLHCESARWGDMDKAVPFTRADSTHLPGKPLGDWQRNTAYTRTVWLPERRVHFLNRMEEVLLYQP